MSERPATQGGTGGPTFDRGDRAAIIGEGKDAGVRGEVFWVGENKYGPGMRYGLRSDDGQTYWVDEAHLGTEEQAPEPPKRPAGEQREALDRGARVTIKAGSGEGKSGEVFWVGKSKYREGMRYGVRVDDIEEAFWVDDYQVEPDANAPPAGADQGSRNGEARRPEGDNRDELPPEAYDDEALPPEAYEDSEPPAAYEGEEPPPPEAYDDAELPPEAYEQDD